jgi:hypothetical protein
MKKLSGNINFKESMEYIFIFLNDNFDNLICEQELLRKKSKFLSIFIKFKEYKI